MKIYIIILILIILANLYYSNFNSQEYTNKSYIFYDIHDSDYKKIIFKNNGNFTILPYKSNKKWLINSKLKSNLTAMVNFNVKGKPNPPPISIELKLSYLVNLDNTKTLVAVFFDPTGKLSPPHIPLNIWYNIT